MEEKIKLLNNELKKDGCKQIPPDWFPFIKFCESLGPEEIKILKMLDGHHMPTEDSKKKIIHYK